MPGDSLGYFGWPTLARMDDGTLVAAASGLRNDHVCPYGRNVFCTSPDQGQSWSAIRVVNDSPLDDRDTGAVCVGGDRWLLTWFTIDSRARRHHRDPALAASWEPGYSRITDANVAQWVGAWACASDDAGDTWQAPVRVPLTAPHGPIRLRDGGLLYFGKEFTAGMAGFSNGVGAIAAARSSDGLTWEPLGKVPLHEGTAEGNYHEPHVAELPDGRLLGLIRFERAPHGPEPETLGLVDFSIFQSMSDDGGRTWSRADPMGFHGCPPHVLVHSSGVLVCVYGDRRDSPGQRVMLSHDRGTSWTYDYILRDDGPDGDLGYPSSVELDNGDILTVYYQKPTAAQDKCAILWSKWTVPD